MVAQLAKHFKLGIIANQNTKIKQKLEDAGVLQHFLYKAVSADVGLTKPDPEYFKYVLNESGAAANCAVMIDDNPVRGLYPAKSLGMTTVWYKLADNFHIQQDSIDYTIGSLVELESIVNHFGVAI